MFLDISVENFRSIKEMQTLSFEATKDPHLDDYFVVAKGEYRILRSVSILGANASGKSNIIRAFHLLRNMVLTPPPSRGEEIAFDAFALDAAWRGRDTIIETNFVCEDKKYQYRIEMNNKFVRREELHCKPFGGKTHLVYQRTTDDEGVVSAVKWGGKYASAEARKMKVNLMPNGTVLSSYQRSNVDLPWMKTIVDWFDDVMMPNITPTTQGLADYTTRSILDHNVGKGQVLELLMKADVGIDDVQVKKEKRELPKQLVDMILNDKDAPEEVKEKIKEDPTSDGYHVKLRHTGTGGSVLMEFDEESKGTQRYYALSAVLLRLMHGEHFVAIDELEYRLHPDLYQHFITTFLLSRNNSQIVYTTHNREYLNDKDLFRNDSVYFTEKSDEGATELYSLVDFDTDTVRNTTNILNAYKAGRLGAIPRLGDYYMPTENSNTESHDENHQ